MKNNLENQNENGTLGNSRTLLSGLPPERPKMRVMTSTGKSKTSADVRVVRVMTKEEYKLIQSAMDILQRLAPYHEPRATDPWPQDCPVAEFARRHLTHDPSGQ